MAEFVRWDCEVLVAAETDDDFVTAVDHAKTVHALTLTRDLALAMATVE